MEGRIIRVNRNNYSVLTNEEKQYPLKHGIETPVVGDYVEVRNGYIDKVYPRKTVLKRKAIRQDRTEQIICSNIDLVYICLSANKDFNIKKYNDFKRMTQNRGFAVKVLLTKTDLTNDVDLFIEQLDLPVTAVSITKSIEHLKEEIKGKTVCLVGASGVGKSSIISMLIEEKIKVSDIRESDAQGRHTTSNRTMYIKKDYAVIDIPGIRIVQSTEDDFSKIVIAAQYCKFRNCKHLTEPKCHVKKLIKIGKIEQELLDQYHHKIKAY